MSLCARCHGDGLGQCACDASSEDADRQELRELNGCEALLAAALDEARAMALGAMAPVPLPAEIGVPFGGRVLRGRVKALTALEGGTLHVEFVVAVQAQVNMLRLWHDSPGSSAYRAYAESTGGRTVDDRPMPAWPELPPRIRAAWEAAAAAGSKAKA